MIYLWVLEEELITGGDTDEGDEDNEGGDGGEAATLSRGDESFDEFSGARLKSLE